jgi:transcriptional regulator with XRE-family HTH domain
VIARSRVAHGIHSFAIGGSVLRLKAYRQHLGRKACAVARDAGIRREDYHGIENGRLNPRNGELERIAAVLGIADPTWLLQPVEFDVPSAMGGVR